MIVRRHSVFFKLHTFFIIASIVLVLLLTSAYQEQEVQRQTVFVHRSIELSNSLEQIQQLTCYAQNTKLDMLGFKSIKSLNPKAKRLILPPYLDEKLRLK